MRNLIVCAAAAALFACGGSDGPTAVSGLGLDDDCVFDLPFEERGRWPEEGEWCCRAGPGAGKCALTRRDNALFWSTERSPICDLVETPVGRCAVRAEVECVWMGEVEFSGTALMRQVADGVVTATGAIERPRPDTCDPSFDVVMTREDVDGD